MRSAAWAAVLATVAVVALAAPEAPVPIPQGFVTDLARVIPPDTEARITRLLEELRQKTGAEIAVVTVESTDPLDDFTYALRIADAWKPGHKGEDTGIVFLVAVRDRKLRILTGYGVEGILPDGLVGEIEDREILPAFHAGRLDDGIRRGSSSSSCWSSSPSCYTGHGSALLGWGAPGASSIRIRLAASAARSAVVAAASEDSAVAASEVAARAGAGEEDRACGEQERRFSA